MKEKKIKISCFVIYDFSRIKIIIYSKSIRNTVLVLTTLLWVIILEEITPANVFKKSGNLFSLNLAIFYLINSISHRKLFF